jgi:hypothetical protein
MSTAGRLERLVQRLGDISEQTTVQETMATCDEALEVARTLASEVVRGLTRVGKDSRVAYCEKMNPLGALIFPEAERVFRSTDDPELKLLTAVILMQDPRKPTRAWINAFLQGPGLEAQDIVIAINALSRAAEECAADHAVRILSESDPRSLGLHNVLALASVVVKFGRTIEAAAVEKIKMGLADKQWDAFQPQLHVR